MKRLCIIILAMTILTLISCYAASAAAGKPSQDPIGPDAGKKVISVFIIIPDTYKDKETINGIVDEKLGKLFPEDKFAVLPIDECTQAMKTHMNDKNHGSRKPDNSDIQTLSQQMGADYALWIDISNGDPQMEINLLKSTYKAAVTCDIKLIEAKYGKLIAGELINAKGETTGSTLSKPSFDRTYSEALKKALNRLSIDTTKL